LLVIDGFIGFQIGAQEVMIGGNPTQLPGIGVLGIIWSLATLLPGIGVMVRRVHDSDKSGWLVLLGYVLMFACGIGAILLLILALLKSTPGDNKYGPENA
jgi:uncharacterized membrane protein YhaH (DUF805 family)